MKKDGEPAEPVDHLFAHELIRRASDAPREPSAAKALG